MSIGDPRLTLSTFWTNLYLRGQMLYDPDGAMGNGAYQQPETAGVPASRTFIIGPDQTIAFPFFGHDPDLIIDKIYGLLGSVEGDFDADDDVDRDDFDRFDSCFTGPGEYLAPGCVPADFDRDDDIDCHDWYAFVGAWTEPQDPPDLGLCSQEITLSVGRMALSWTAADGAFGYDVVQGDLLALRAADGDYTNAVDRCVIDDHADTTLPYPDEPAPGSAFWLLARGVAVSLNMTYDALAESQVGNRDAEIDTSPATCP